MVGRRENGRRSPVVVVAIEPRAYAQVIGAAIAAMRSRFDVRIVEPEDIDSEAQRCGADLVLCSRPRKHPTGGGPCWVEYAPYAGASQAEVRVDGVAVGKSNVTLAELLEILDQAIPPGHV